MAIKTYTTTVTADKTWAVDVDGSALVNNKGHDVHASVTANDGAGHSTTASDDKTVHSRYRDQSVNYH
ncbi:hypothetical protein [Photobacterium leiognathi]|uniref:hypothetical protein n=1 Tax=Photobacterium leiognathi TaxID=553611 RepID=UPI0027346679|nr:hypothetical protein [Photobacterium leiognathi]